MTGKLSLLAFLTVAAMFPSCGGRVADVGRFDQGTGGTAGTASGGNGGTGGTHSTGGTGGSHTTGGTGGSDANGGTGGSDVNGGTGGIGGTSGEGGTSGGSGGTSGSGAYPGGGGSGAVSSGGGYGGDIQQACGGAVCADNEICCYATGNCFDPSSSPEACATPSEDECSPPATSCNSDADCAADSYCKPELGCTSPGCCISKVMCGGMSETSCGCDGQSLDYHWACAAGIPTMDWSCGTQSWYGLTACGNSSSWCPGSQQCCAITGTCYDPSKPELCKVPPAGTYFPCIQDADCPMPGDFCVGPTCGAPGGCVHQAAHDDCTGQWDPVCGCDGNTYVNPVCAQASSMAVAHEGECSDAGL